MSEELSVDEVMDELTKAIASITQFMYFLRQREHKFLSSEEPEFVKTVRRSMSSGDVLDINRITTLYLSEIKPLLKKSPSEWVKLMQEASDIRVSVRQVRALVKAASADNQHVQSISGIYRVGEWIELLLYSEADINYRIVERLKRSVNRAKKRVGQNNDIEVSNQIEKLEELRKTREKGFRNPRNSITHVVNFGQDGLIKDRMWELVCIFENPVSPSEVLIRKIEENISGHLTLIHSEAKQTAKLVLDFYPELKVLLERQFPE